jgi:exosortase A-associated hydrolase 2
MSAAQGGGLRPFFFQGTRGRLYCLLHERNPGAAPASAVLFLPPFAEELNKSRRMVALQARELVTLGHSVLVPDLYGTGDSEGDFADSLWETWIEDLALLCKWLGDNQGAKLSLWSLRTGVLLGADLLAATGLAPADWLLWQPVANGQLFLRQFLRLALAAELGEATRQWADTRSLREALGGGSSVEIAGYQLTGRMASALDGRLLSAAALGRAARLGWFELTPSEQPALSAVAKRLVEECRGNGRDVDAQSIQGPAFWSTPETTIVPALVAASTGFMARRKQARSVA